MVFVYQYQFTLIFCFFGHVIGKKNMYEQDEALLFVVIVQESP